MNTGKKNHRARKTYNLHKNKAVRVPYGTPIQKWYILVMLLYRLN